MSEYMGVKAIEGHVKIGEAVWALGSHQIYVQLYIHCAARISITVIEGHQLKVAETVASWNL